MTPQALSNPSQLIARNAVWLECDRMLMIGMPADNLAQQLLAENITGQITGLSKDFADYSRIQSLWHSDDQSLSYAPVLDLPEGEVFDGILIFLQKSKPLMDFWIEMALSRLVEGGVLWLVGENGEGIKSWKKRLKNTFAQVKSLDNARHCVLFEASEPMGKVSDFNYERYFQRFDIHQGKQDIAIHSLPGVFSHGRLDVGTKVLLDTFDDLPEGKVLDFGCGAGGISACAQKLTGKRSFTLVDSDALALASSQKTMTEAGADFEVLASDGLGEVEGEFDLILSNPPFHQGVKTHYEVSEQFLAESYRHLKKGGELRIVANSFLRYPSIIKQTFGHCKTLLTRDGFSIYRAFKH